jgi:hypothetical protein
MQLVQRSNSILNEVIKENEKENEAECDDSSQDNMSDESYDSDVYKSLPHSPELKSQIVEEKLPEENKFLKAV